MTMPNLANEPDDIYSLDGTPGAAEAAIRREMDESHSDIDTVTHANLSAIHGGPPPLVAPMGFPNFENAPVSTISQHDAQP